MDIGVDAVFLHEVVEDIRIGGSHFLTLKPLKTVVFDFLGDGQGETALAEAQT